MIKIEKIFGHEIQKEILNKKFNSYNSDTWMFYGEKNIGKFNFAKNFIIENLAKKLFNTEKEIFTLTSNELKDINKNLLSCYFHLNEHENVSIDEIRKLFSQLELTNFSEKIPKYIVIDNFETININSKNALLKTLEEPPEKVFIFLICHNIFEVPKTITSRCKKIEFKSLSSSDFEIFLKHNLFDFEHLNNKRTIDYINNKPGIFKLLQKYNFQENIILMEKIIKNDEINYLDIQKLIDNFSDNLSLLILILKNFLYKRTKSNFVEKFGDITNCEKIFNFFDNIKSNLNESLNINKNQYILSIFVNYFKNIKSKNE